MAFFVTGFISPFPISLVFVVLSINIPAQHVFHFHLQLICVFLFYITHMYSYMLQILRFCLSCHHVICKECWADGLSAYVDSVESLRTTCFTSCDMVVPRSVFQKFLNQENFAKYERWLAKKFVECSSKLRYCPKPGCNVSVFTLLKI
jgi:hypothetical protein